MEKNDSNRNNGRNDGTGRAQENAPAPRFRPSTRPGDPGFATGLEKAFSAAEKKHAPHDLISVIIPAYNTEKYIAACLASVVSQAYPFLEIIVCDDGSSDRTADIADMFAIGDPRITVLRLGKQGPGPARNTGMDHAHGKYTAFIDSDDFISAGYFGHLVLTARLFPGRMPVTQHTRTDCEEIPSRAIGPRALKEEDCIRVLIMRYLYDTALLRDHNLRFTEARHYEDLIFNCEYTAARGNSKGIETRARYFHRIRPGSTSREHGLARLRTVRHGTDIIMRKLEEFRQRRLPGWAIRRLEEARDDSRRIISRLEKETGTGSK